MHLPHDFKIQRVVGNHDKLGTETGNMLHKSVSYKLFDVMFSFRYLSGRESVVVHVDIMTRSEDGVLFDAVMLVMYHNVAFETTSK